jgi:hypothetical protein
LGDEPVIGLWTIGRRLELDGTSHYSFLFSVEVDVALISMQFYDHLISPGTILLIEITADLKSDGRR